MKLIRTLKITSEEFYNYLERQLKNDILKTANKKVDKIETGLTYSQHAKEQFARIDFKILDYERGHCYKMRMKSYTEETVICYETEETPDGLHVIFEQQISNDKNKHPHKLTSKLTEVLYLSRMSRTIYDIENAIINERSH